MQQPPGLAEPLRLKIVLDQGLLQGRTKLGEKVQDLCRGGLAYNNFTCPNVELQVGRESLPPQAGYKRIQFQVPLAGGGWKDAKHVAVCFTPQEFIRAANADGLSSVVCAVTDAHPGYRIHLLTYEADGACSAAAARGVVAASSPAATGSHAMPAGSIVAASSQAAAAAAAEAMRARLWQLITDLMVWRPDVSYHNAANLDEAAQQVVRIARAVAEEGHKKTDVRSYLGVALQSEAALAKQRALEQHWGRWGVQRDGSAATCMKALLGVAGVSAGAAYAVGNRFGSLQQLLEELERDATQAVQTIAGLPLPASTAVVGLAAAQKIQAALKP